MDTQVLDVVKQLNWSAGKRPIVHVSMDVDAPGRGGGFVEERRGTMFVRAETDFVTVEVNGTGASSTRFTLGAAAPVTLVLGGTGVASANIAASTIPQEAFVSFSIDFSASGGSSLDQARIQDLEPLTVPEPQDE